MGIVPVGEAEGSGSDGPRLEAVVAERLHRVARDDQQTVHGQDFQEGKVGSLELDPDGHRIDGADSRKVVAETRRDDGVALGVSPRAAMNWIRAARARACVQGRSHVLPDDLKALARPVLAHRVFLRGGGDSGETIERILDEVPVVL